MTHIRVWFLKKLMPLDDTGLWQLSEVMPPWLCGGPAPGLHPQDQPLLEPFVYVSWWGAFLGLANMLSFSCMHSSVLTHILPEIGIHCFLPLFPPISTVLSYKRRGQNKHIISFCSFHFLLCPRQDQLKVPLCVSSGTRSFSRNRLIKSPLITRTWKARVVQPRWLPVPLLAM